MDLKIVPIYIWSVCESNTLNAIADPQARVKDVAIFYADMIRCELSQSRRLRNFTKVNRAIMARWSFSALDRCKAMARKLVACGR